MELNFENKYKDRTPEETCEILEKFFADRGYQIDLFPLKADIDLYSYHILLKKDNYIVLFSNGKGMSEIYAKASGLAELYERFCNFSVYMWSPMFWQKREELGIQFKNSKSLSYDDVLRIPIFNKKMQHLTNSIPDKVYYLIDDMKIVPCFGVPYKFIGSEEQIYLDPILITKVNLSTGMSAGNTFEEAFIQGSAEILERFVTYNFIINPPNKLYEFNKELLSSELKEKIKKIEAQNKVVHIFDLSYNYMLPVVATLVIDKIRHFSRINFASNPVFDIAVERTLTEMYQNIATMTEKWVGLQVPFFAQPGEEILESNSTGLRDASIFPEYLLNSIETVNTYNNFIKTNLHSNTEIFNWVKNLFTSAQIDLCYRDCSLDKNMVALHIVALNLSVDYDTKIIMQDNDWKEYVQRMSASNAIFHELTKDKYDFDIIFNNIEHLLPKSKNSQFFWEIAVRDRTNPLETRTIDILYIIFQHFDVPSEMIHLYSDSIYYYNLTKFIFINDYLKAKYTNQEIISYGNYFGFSDITNEDIENINDLKYLLTEIWIKPIHNFYHSHTYEEIVRSFS